MPSDSNLGDALNNLVLTVARAARIDKLADWLARVIDGGATPAEPMAPPDPLPWDCARQGCDIDRYGWEPTVTCRVCGRTWTRLGNLMPGQSITIVATLPAAALGPGDSADAGAEAGEAGTDAH